MIHDRADDRGDRLAFCDVGDADERLVADGLDDGVRVAYRLLAAADEGSEHVVGVHPSAVRRYSDSREDI